jgi:hydrogenase expression/formation protein HypC
MERDGPTARVGLRGSVREVDVSMVGDVAAGDWVLVHAGFAIERLDEEDARQTLDSLAEVEEALGSDASP